MALQTSGPISLNDIHVEAGGSSGTTCSMNDPDIRGLTPASGRTINSTQGTNTDFADYYGATAEVALPTSGSTVNGQVQLKQILSIKLHIIWWYSTYTFKYVGLVRH